MKKSKNKIHENARVTRSKVNVSVGKVDDKKSDKKKSRNVCKYVFRDIVFTDVEEVEFNLGAIHQDSLGYEHRNDSDHSIPPITEDAFTVLKNEIANVRRDMSLFQEKVDSQFNGMREFVEESVKLILNELILVKQQSSEFVEKENVDVGLQTPSASKKQDEVLVDPVIEKYSFGGAVHSKNISDHVQSLSTMILMFLVATDFYGKCSDIDWHRKAIYIDKSLSELLEYVILKDTPQQGP
ncbi:hypothetical protein FXO38_27518 [Capsicum annuum]|nr:hypothetical protein FXO38_27518 [Capsicum annuum]KAF3676215.1 hypothetical protein FXO37_05437 [Capsicum annuum]